MLKTKPLIFYRETPFRDHVIDVARKAGFHVTHIESPVTSAGVPDLNLYSGVDVWLELKVWSDYAGVKMRPTQRVWHRLRHEAQGLSWVLLHHDGNLSLIPGDVAARLKSKDQAWTRDYLIGPNAELPRVLEDCRNDVSSALTDFAYGC
jgi:hypothetical protein